MSQILEDRGRNREVDMKWATATDDADTNVVLTLAADAGEIHVLDTLLVSYKGTIITGRLTIAIGGVTKLDVDISDTQLRQLDLRGMNSGKKNEAVVITLYAGGTGNTGKLTLGYF